MTLRPWRPRPEDIGLVRTDPDLLTRRQPIRGNVQFLTVTALFIALAAAGCGDASDSAASQPASTPNSADQSDLSGQPAEGTVADGTKGGAPEAVVTLAGTSYRFAGDNPQCREVSGGLIVGLPLAEIDGASVPDGAGFFDMTLYPEGLEDESAISVKLPDGRLLAGNNEIGLPTTPVSLQRDGLGAGGNQTLSAHTGEKTEAMIEVKCG